MHGLPLSLKCSLPALAIVTICGTVCPTADFSELRFIDPDPATGTSTAVAVPPGFALAHTGIILPVNRDDEVVNEGDAAGQAARVLANANWALAAAGTGREYTVMLNVYAANEAALAAARGRVAEAFPGPTHPAATWTIGEQPRASVLVSMDCVAVAPLRAPDRVTRFLSHQLPRPYASAHVAVMPPGEVLHLVEPIGDGASLAAVGEAADRLRRRLEEHGLTAEHVVQVRASIKSMAEANGIWKQIAAALGRELAPPTVIVPQQASAPRPASVEVIAVRPGARGEDAEATIYPPSR
ncbi:MAG: Rid family hydrolase [Thermoguttaceae bacterium]|jgi:enamine deaminase RidA (YjgF/YER057c/UK114 family)|nr:Rid family hydrolase [Thermoguttaceae bacterium]